MNFFLINITYQRQTGEDNPGKVKETYVVESINPSNAEARLLEEIKPFIFGDHEVQRINKRNFRDIFPKADGEYWYTGRVEMITVEDNGRECRKAVTVLVEACDITDALNILKKEMASYDCEIIGVAKSPIVDVYRV